MALPLNQLGIAPESVEKAQKAIKVFRGMQHGLTAYARAITGDHKIRIQISSGPPRTDGKTIYYQPPIGLGDKRPHDKFYCDKRDDEGLMVCPACKLREEVLVNIYHEISHIAFGTYASDENYKQLAARIDKYLPHVVNFFEDARVDSAMIEARKGIRKMLQADTMNILRKGVTNADGEPIPTSAVPLNSQITYAGYLSVIGFTDWEQFFADQIVRDVADPELSAVWAQMREAKTAGEMYDLTKVAWKRMQELGYYLDEPPMPPDEPEEDQEPEEESSDPDDEEQTEPDESDKEEDNEPEEQDQDGDGDEGDCDVSSGQDESEEDRDSDKEGEGDSGDGADGDGERGGDSESDESGETDGSSDADGTDAGDAEGSGESGYGDQEAGDEQSPEPDQDGSDTDAPEGEDGGSDAAPEDSGESGSQAGREGEQGSEHNDSSEGVRGSGGMEHESESPPSAEGSDREDERPDDSGKAGEEEVDATDQDGVPEESGEGSEPSEGSVPGSSEAEEGSESEVKQEDSSEQPDHDADGGSDEGEESEADRSDQQSDDSGDPGEIDGVSDTSEADGERDQHDESGQEGGQGDTSGSEVSSDERAPDSDQVDQDSGDDAPDAGADRPEADAKDEDESPDGPFESGADQGLGGIKVEEISNCSLGYGDEIDVADLHDQVHNDPESANDEEIVGTADEQETMAIMVIQGMYFETPSLGVSRVEEHTYAPGALGWNAPDSKTWRIQNGVDADLDIPETVLGPALLKTRRIFSDNQNAIHQKNLRSGRVNAKVLGRRAWNDDDRLFGKKRIPGKKDYAVLISMDISSSNLGDNLALLKRSVMAQAELLHRVGIPFSIIAHSCTFDNGKEYSYEGRAFAMHIHHIKDWDESWTSALKERMENLTALGGNLDGHALEFMRKRMERVQATDKIILYYSDGKMPAANYDEELEVLERQIKLCKRDGVELLGVGIRTDSPTEHGLDTVQVDTDDDLKTVVEHLGKRLLRSAR